MRKGSMNTFLTGTTSQWIKLFQLRKSSIDTCPTSKGIHQCISQLFIFMDAVFNWKKYTSIKTRFLNTFSRWKTKNQSLNWEKHFISTFQNFGSKTTNTFLNWNKHEYISQLQKAFLYIHLFKTTYFFLNTFQIFHEYISQSTQVSLIHFSIEELSMNTHIYSKTDPWIHFLNCTNLSLNTFFG